MTVWPDVVPRTLGSHAVYHHQDHTPAHCYDSLICPLANQGLLELCSRDSFDETLATFLLDCVTGTDLPALGSKRIGVLAARFPRPWPFECVVVVPPRTAERFDHLSRRLKRVTYWAAPAFAYEFRDGESGESFWYQIRRRDGWQVDLISWHRDRKTAPSWT
jgi:hypothetical protein